jgi:hypothetical protein
MAMDIVRRYYYFSADSDSRYHCPDIESKLSKDMWMYFRLYDRPACVGVCQQYCAGSGSGRILCYCVSVYNVSESASGSTSGVDIDVD